VRCDARKASVHALESLAVMVLCFVAGRIGLAVPFTHGNVSPLWPSAGIALAAILIFGWHVCLGIAAGAFLANFFTPIPHLAALFLGVGNTLGPAVAASLLRRKLVLPLQRLRDVLSLTLFGSLGTAISALIGSSTLFLAGVNTGGGLPATIALWCFGDLIGIFLVAPLLLNFTDFKLTRPRLAELGLLMASLLAGSEVLFHQNTVAGAVFGLLLLPFVLWGAARFSIGGATLTCLAASTFAVWETGRGVGPFLTYGTSVHHAHALQIFIAALSLSGLCLGAVIAERTRAQAALAREEKLRRAEEQYRNIIETTNDGVWMIDSDFRTTFVNRRMAEMLGYTPEEMLRRTPVDFVFPEDIPSKQADLERRRKGVREVFYTRYRKKDGSELWALVSSTPVYSVTGTFDGALAMQSDVTLLRKTEEALRRNEKLITAGRLAAALAHEVNNPLEAVVNLLYLLKAEPMGEQARQYVELASREIHRVSAISQRSLGFFRDTSAWANFSLPHLLDDTLSFFERDFAARGTEVVRDYRTCGLARGSRSEMQQVFANLIANALDAMGHRGVLTVRVYDSYSPQIPGIAVEVEDTGAGISSDDLNRIFEPFFTTKQNTGTGLGLWIAREIIQKHGGTIAVRSECCPGVKSGTQFSIFLPAAAAADAVA
jgi:PAS domain S-box-containing protein